LSGESKSRGRSKQPLPLIRALLFSASTCLSGCSGAGAPSFDMFGAFFPAWMICALIGIAGAIAIRAVFVGTGLSGVLPYQLFVCTAIGIIAAILAWLLAFGR
jgi:hypothetical protein